MASIRLQNTLTQGLQRSSLTGTGFSSSPPLFIAAGMTAEWQVNGSGSVTYCRAGQDGQAEDCSATLRWQVQPNGRTAYAVRDVDGKLKVSIQDTVQQAIYVIAERAPRRLLPPRRRPPSPHQALGRSATLHLTWPALGGILATTAVVVLIAVTLARIYAAPLLTQGAAHLPASLATLVPPNCISNISDMPYKPISSLRDDIPLPPQTYTNGSNGATGTILHFLCSGGTQQSIDTFMNVQLPQHGWTLTATRTGMKPPCTISWDFNTGNPMPITWIIYTSRFC